LKNVFEAADTRQKQAKKRSLCVINEHFEPVFNTVAATQIVFQRPVRALQLNVNLNLITVTRAFPVPSVFACTTKTILTSMALIKTVHFIELDLYDRNNDKLCDAF